MYEICPQHRDICMSCPHFQIEDILPCPVPRKGHVLERPVLSPGVSRVPTLGEGQGQGTLSAKHGYTPIHLGLQSLEDCTPL